MSNIVGVKFKNTGKVYFFDPLDIVFAEGDGVIVETVRGVEFGRIATPNREVPESEITQPLKPVLRKATARDEQVAADNERKRDGAIKLAEERIAAHGLAMKLVDAEYTFDCKKLVFYFTSDSRVDFRELVKDLAAAFRIRIELRQISERDDIKMRGALAPCGRPCCCATFLSGFEKVSLKMAKAQGLSLNPTKISGLCGKLMCCLKYENDFYVQEGKKMPSVGCLVHTADGTGVCIGVDILRGVCKVKYTRDDTDSYGSYSVADVTFTPRGKQCPAKKTRETAEDELDEVSEEELKNLED